MEVIGLILGLLGLFGWSLLSQVFNETILQWWYRFTWTPERVQAETRSVVSRNLIRFREIRDVTTYSVNELRVQWYIDFLSAITRLKERRALERCLVRWLQLRKLVKVDKLAVPKLGNVLLADAVARRLKLPLIVVRQEEGQFVRGDGIDGDLRPGEHILLVDDVASDCDFLARCVGILQDARANVAGVIVMVERKEGFCGETLSRANLVFDSILSLGDDDLATLDRSDETLIATRAFRKRQEGPAS